MEKGKVHRLVDALVSSGDLSSCQTGKFSNIKILELLVNVWYIEWKSSSVGCSYADVVVEEREDGKDFSIR